MITVEELMKRVPGCDHLMAETLIMMEREGKIPDVDTLVEEARVSKIPEIVVEGIVVGDPEPTDEKIDTSD